MVDRKEKGNFYGQDLILGENSFSKKIYNYFYIMLKEKKEISILEIYILYSLETIQLISYGLSEPHTRIWKENNSTLKTISDIIGILRITPLMKYVKFNIYLIIFFFFILLIFSFCVFLLVQILFFKSESKFFVTSVTIIRSLIYPLYLFCYIPLTEMVLLPLKCNSENKVDIVKDGIICWENLQYLYSILGIISSLLFFLCILFLINFFFYPFNYDNSSIRIQSHGDSLFLFIKYIFVLRFIFVKNEYLSIAILLILSLYATVHEFYYHSFNNVKLEVIVNLKNFLSLWIYLILFLAKLFKTTKINGLIYIFCFGIPFIIIFCVLQVNKYESNIDYNIDNFSSVNEYLNKTRVLIKLITLFIKSGKNIRFGNESINQKEDILLKGIIKVHTISCLEENCPLTKYVQNLGNYNVQRQCLFNYMTIYFNQGMKRFPFSTELVLYYIHFNLSNRINLNAVRNNISVLEKRINTNKINFLIFILSKDILDIKSKNINGDLSNYEQEYEILNQKYRRLKFLIENSTKLYGEFWGIFATNVTNNLNTFKLYNLGEKLNIYLKEMNTLWDNELKLKKVDTENEVIIQLYSRFLREILWNKKKSEEIFKKINDEKQHYLDNRKLDNIKSAEGNIEAELENPNYIIYASSNERGECFIVQCTNSISNLLGYMKNEIIGKKIEKIMPEIFRKGHANMLAEKIKYINLKHKSNRNSYREYGDKNIFIVAKSKIGYLIPLNAKISLEEDTDFSDSFIIKSYMEPKDTKSIYAYYILTKNDFTISAISSSAIHLGLTLDIINKYIINIKYLIRDKKCNNIDFSVKSSEYEEELKQVIWIYPDLIYSKNKMNNEIKEKDILELIKSSHKKKIFVQLNIMKFDESNIIGYVFKIVDSISKKKNIDIKEESYLPNSNKEILFDLLSLNYIRTEIVNKKIRNVNLIEKDDNIDNEKQTKIIRGKSKKIINASNMEEIIESSEEEKNIKIELTKEKILEMQTKETKEIEIFINQLPYYGAEIFMEKLRPNREKYAIGRGHEPLIKIEIGHFIKKIEAKIKSDPELMMRYKGTKEEESQNKSFNNINKINQEFSSDTSTSLNNFFITIIGFIFTVLDIQIIKNNIVKMKNAYKLCVNIGFIKYMITEIVLTNKYKEEYNMIKNFFIPVDANIDYFKMELDTYCQEFRSIYEDFNTASPSEFSKKYQQFVSADTQVYIYTLLNGNEIGEYIPYSVAMRRISTTVFYIATITDQSLELDMKERNTYELMFNLLNGYFISIKELTLILAEDAVISSKTAIISTITFYLSFVLSIIFLSFIWYLLADFLIERQKPINLFLTIKKNIFEDLKNASETFSNNLLNKQIGNEDNDEDNQKDYQTNIRQKDINIIKFKAPNENKNKGKNNKEQFRNFIKLVLFCCLIEAYFIFKFSYTNNYIGSVKKFLSVFNITLYSYVDLIINVDLSKSFIYNKSIPILYQHLKQHLS